MNEREKEFNWLLLLINLLLSIHKFTTFLKNSLLRIRIRWIRNILASWIRIRKNMRILTVENREVIKKIPHIYKVQ